MDFREFFMKRIGSSMPKQCLVSCCQRAWIKALAFALVFAAAGVQAQEMEPRAYSNAPIGLNFLITGYAHAQGGVTVDPSVPLTNADIRYDAAAAAFVHSLSVFGRSGKFSAVMPYAWVSGSAQFAGQPRQREVSGPADAKLGFSINFFGAPALSLKEFSKFRQDSIIGASLKLSVPSGHYNPDKLLNIGTNRWSVTPEIGISKALAKWTAELSAAATFYSDNHNFLGGKTREQDPIYSLQGHLIYSFGANYWAALTGTFLRGGQTTIDGVANNDLQRNSRLGVTVSLPVSRHHSIKLYASTGVSTRTGSDFDLIGIGWQYRWGGGL
jgi:hypothetical protein